MHCLEEQCFRVQQSWKERWKQALRLVFLGDNEESLNNLAPIKHLKFPDNLRSPSKQSIDALGFSFEQLLISSRFTVLLMPPINIA